MSGLWQARDNCDAQGEIEAGRREREKNMPLIYHYLVKSGDGYLIRFRFDNDCPLLTTNFVEAFRFKTRNEANASCRIMHDLGFIAKVVELKYVTLGTES